MAIVGLKMVRLALLTLKPKNYLKGLMASQQKVLSKSILKCLVLVPLTSQTWKVKRLKSLGPTQCKML